MMFSRNLSSMLWGVLFFFFAVSASAQYTAASDGDYCFDPDLQATTAAKYSNSTAIATKSIKTPTTLPTLSSRTRAASSPTAPIGSAGSAFAPELVLGLVAALVAVSRERRMDLTHADLAVHRFDTVRSITSNFRATRPTRRKQQGFVTGGNILDSWHGDVIRTVEKFTVKALGIDRGWSAHGA